MQYSDAQTPAFFSGTYHCRDVPLVGSRLLASLFANESAIGTEDKTVRQRCKGTPSAIIDRTYNANCTIRLVVPIHTNVPLVPYATRPVQLEPLRMANFPCQFGISAATPRFELNAQYLRCFRFVHPSG